jgi:thioredoxin reductase (NADPH)
MTSDYEVIIIGAGPAGLTAGIYAARAGLSVVAIEKMVPGGQLTSTDTIENYPGVVKPVSGFELANRMKEQAEANGVKIETAEVLAVEQSPDRLTRTVRTKDYSLKGLALVVATGATPRRLGVAGEDRFWGKGISCCATCDGRFYAGKRVVVVGGGDTAVKEGLFLSRFADKITFVHRRGMFRATKILQDRLLAMKEKVDVVWHAVVKEIQGGNSVQAVVVEDVKTGERRTIETDGVFIFVGFTPNSQFLQGLVDMDERGYILTDAEMRTSAEGIYACGDVRKKLLRQVVTACAEGAVAAFSAEHYIDEKKGKVYA